MAKPPAISIFSPSTGVSNGAYDLWSAAQLTVTAVAYVTDGSFLQVQTASGGVAGHNLAVQYIADTGW
jgi:hypothetical protein